MMTRTRRNRQRINSGGRRCCSSASVVTMMMIVVELLIVVSIGGLAAAQQQQQRRELQQQKCEMEQNANYRGVILVDGVTNLKDTADECCQACRDLFGCNTWAYCGAAGGCYGPYVHKSCFLKALPPEELVLDEVPAWSRGPYTPWTSGILKDAPVIAAEIRAGQEDANQQWNGTNWPAKSNTGTVSSGGFSLEANANYAGEVLVDGRQNLKSSVEECGEACLANPSCTTFSYCGKPEGCYGDFVYQSCFLKRHDNPSAREAYERESWTPWTSGIVERGGGTGSSPPTPSSPMPAPTPSTGTASGGFSLEKNANYAGEVLVDGRQNLKSSVEACGEACLANPSCTTFSYCGKPEGCYGDFVFQSCFLKRHDNPSAREAYERESWTPWTSGIVERGGDSGSSSSPPPPSPMPTPSTGTASGGFSLETNANYAGEVLVDGRQNLRSSVEECGEACLANPSCTTFSYCAKPEGCYEDFVFQSCFLKRHDNPQAREAYSRDEWTPWTSGIVERGGGTGSSPPTPSSTTPAPTPSTGTASGGFSLEKNANYAGEVLVDGRQNLKSSVEECGEACLANPSCTTFSYCGKPEGCYGDFVFQSCFLKRHDNPSAREAYERESWTPWTSGIVERGGDSGSSSSPPPPSPMPTPSTGTASGGFSLETNANYAGEVLVDGRQNLRSSVEECGEACLANPSCTTFSYCAKPEGCYEDFVFQSCFLKRHDNPQAREAYSRDEWTPWTSGIVERGGGTGSSPPTPSSTTPAPTPSTGTASGGFSLEKNANYAGEVLVDGRQNLKSSVEECGEACLANPSCTTFSYCAKPEGCYEDFVFQSCFLKRHDNPQAREAYSRDEWTPWTSGIVERGGGTGSSSSPPPSSPMPTPSAGTSAGGFSLEANANYAGDVLVDGRQNLRSSVEECGEACLANPSCTTFSYCGKPEGCYGDFVYQSCFLKRHDNPSAREAYERESWTPWTSGIVERGGGTGSSPPTPSSTTPAPTPSTGTASGGFSLEKNANYAGEVLVDGRQNLKSSVEACGEACLANPSCTTFSYCAKPEGCYEDFVFQSCFLKRHDNPQAREAYSRDEWTPWTSGIVERGGGTGSSPPTPSSTTPAPTPSTGTASGGFSLEKNANYAGDVLVDGRQNLKSSVEACGEACLANPSCTTFSYCAKPEGCYEDFVFQSCFLKVHDNPQAREAYSRDEWTPWTSGIVERGGGTGSSSSPPPSSPTPSTGSASGGFSLEANANYAGRVLVDGRQNLKSSVEECGESCLANPQCTTFAYCPKPEGCYEDFVFQSCFLKVHDNPQAREAYSRDEWTPWTSGIVERGGGTGSSSSPPPSSPTPSTGSASGGFSLEANANYAGRVLVDGRQNLKSSVEECGESCLANPQCTTFAYCPKPEGCYEDFVFQSCFLKVHDNPQAREAYSRDEWTPWTSGIVERGGGTAGGVSPYASAPSSSPAPAPTPSTGSSASGGFSLEANANYAGRVLVDGRQNLKSSVEECGESCLANPQCTTFAYCPKPEGCYEDFVFQSCFLKVHDNPQAREAYSRDEWTPWTGGIVERGGGTAGGVSPYASAPSSSSAPKPSTGSASGGFSLETNANYAGEVLVDGRQNLKSSVEACGESCLANPQCTTFAYCGKPEGCFQDFVFQSCFLKRHSSPELREAYSRDEWTPWTSGVVERKGTSSSVGVNPATWSGTSPPAVQQGGGAASVYSNVPYVPPTADIRMQDGKPIGYPNPLEPPRGVYFGVSPQEVNGTADLQMYLTAFGGFVPVNYNIFVHIPILDYQLRYLDQFLAQVAGLGGVATVTVEPFDGLDLVTPSTIAPIVERCAFFERMRASCIVRFAHEMNGGWYPWSRQPTKYVEKFRLVSDAVRRGTKRGAVMWSPNSAARDYPFAAPSDLAGNPEFARLDTNRDGIVNNRDDPFGPYWPGDSYVDWVGLSVYHFGVEYPFGKDNEAAPRDSFLLRVAPRTLGEAAADIPFDFYETYAVGKSKPLAIGETGALFMPSKQRSGTPSELEVKRSWWQQFVNGGPGGTSLSTLLPQLKLITWFDIVKFESEVNSVVDWRVSGSPQISVPFQKEMLTSPASRGFMLDLNAYHGLFPSSCIDLDTPVGLVSSDAANAAVTPYHSMPLSGGVPSALPSSVRAAAPMCSIERNSNYRGTVVVNGHTHRTATAGDCCASCFGEVPGGGGTSYAATSGATMTSSSLANVFVWCADPNGCFGDFAFGECWCKWSDTPQRRVAWARGPAVPWVSGTRADALDADQRGVRDDVTTFDVDGSNPMYYYEGDASLLDGQLEPDFLSGQEPDYLSEQGNGDRWTVPYPTASGIGGGTPQLACPTVTTSGSGGYSGSDGGGGSSSSTFSTMNGIAAALRDASTFEVRPTTNFQEWHIAMNVTNPLSVPVDIGGMGIKVAYSPWQQRRDSASADSQFEWFPADFEDFRVVCTYAFVVNANGEFTDPRRGASADLQPLNVCPVMYTVFDEQLGLGGAVTPSTPESLRVSKMIGGTTTSVDSMNPRRYFTLVLPFGVVLCPGCSLIGDPDGVTFVLAASNGVNGLDFTRPPAAVVDFPDDASSAIRQQQHGGMASTNRKSQGALTCLKMTPDWRTALEAQSLQSPSRQIPPSTPRQPTAGGGGGGGGMIPMLPSSGGGGSPPPPQQQKTDDSTSTSCQDFLASASAPLLALSPPRHTSDGSMWVFSGDVLRAPGPSAGKSLDVSDTSFELAVSPWVQPSTGGEYELASPNDLVFECVNLELSAQPGRNICDSISLSARDLEGSAAIVFRIGFQRGAEAMPLCDVPNQCSLRGAGSIPVDSAQNIAFVIRHRDAPRMRLDANAPVIDEDVTCSSGGGVTTYATRDPPALPPAGAGLPSGISPKSPALNAACAPGTMLACNPDGTPGEGMQYLVNLLETLPPSNTLAMGFGNEAASGEAIFIGGTILRIDDQDIAAAQQQDGEVTAMQVSSPPTPSSSSTLPPLCMAGYTVAFNLPGPIVAGLPAPVEVGDFEFRCVHSTTSSVAKSAAGNTPCTDKLVLSSFANPENPDALLGTATFTANMELRNGGWVVGGPNGVLLAIRHKDAQSRIPYEQVIIQQYGMCVPYGP